MAKWGEGDPRWIVEERPDAVNVNNWHWTEKNACDWSQNKFKELLIDLKLQTNDYRARITKIEKAEGEALVNNRKGKLIFFYDWQLTLCWKGKVKGADDYVTGQFAIPNLSDENDISEVVVNVSVNESTEDALAMKQFLHKTVTEKIHEPLQKYLQALREEFTKGMILPTKNEDGKQNVNLNTNLINKVKNIEPGGVNVNKNSSTTGSNNDNSGTITLTQKFQCTGEELYNVLTCPELVRAWTQCSGNVNPVPNGSFDLFGGNILGTFDELVQGKIIVQKWRVKSWPQNVYSTVKIELDQQSDHTLLKLKQTKLPVGEVSRTRENWDRYYWGPIKRTFGFGAFL